MTKKKHIITRLVLALVVLTLISCCFLGSTFARYTSGNSGTASVAVAKWNISDTLSGDAAIEFTTLSPAVDGRVNTTPATKALTITNSSEVEATVSVKQTDEFTITTVTTLGDDVTDGAETNPTIYIGSSNYEEVIADIITITFYYVDENGTAYTDAEGNTVNLTELTDDVTATVAVNGTLDIYAIVTWTTDDTEDETVGDLIDTWIGENVTAISFGFEYTAVQSTVLPA